MNIVIKSLLLLLAVAAGSGLTWGLLEYGPFRHQHEIHLTAPTGETHAEDTEAAHTEGHAEAIKLTDEQLVANGLRIETAALGNFASGLSLPGQLVLNTDREARVLSPITGMVRSAPIQIGAQIKAGTVLAVIESPQLSDVAARYLAAKERQVMAQSSFAREESLWQKKISAEQDYLAARRELNDARIETQSALQSLLALGMSEHDAKALKPGGRLASYALRAPISGTVLSKDLTLGEAVTSDKPLFRLADLSTLWIDLAVPVTDLPKIRAGQTVVVTDKAGMSSQGRVIFVQPELDEASRSGSVRVQIDNSQGLWRSGQFVQAQIQTGAVSQTLSVPLSAIQMLENQPTIFVADKDGLEPRTVVLGRRSGDRQGVISGLKVGERYASGNVFVLKADLKKGEAEHED
ncbi:efflux RND transporter periplasmic adaptor subunit [Perlucidibaca aquatica]|jgi:cobalt-zinc-cadmium efflux system membrane fusion protein|uniref:efflux RND transporter periplasmic adaptor subunit n=1 Tax=Perlucidibaca aquatica TaxID=1852776 RepID=UPI00083A3343|nr:efflux RND transporter periplasmic adaptor subunit [Perlucidibaca aquatica]